MVEANNTWVIIVTGIFILLLGIVVISILKPTPKTVPKSSTNIKMKPLLSAKVKAVKTRGYSKVSGYSLRGLKEYDAGNCTYVPSMNPYVSMVVELVIDTNDPNLGTIDRILIDWMVGDGDTTWSGANADFNGGSSFTLTLPPNTEDTTTNIACTSATEDRGDNRILIYYHSTVTNTDVLWGTIDIESLGTAITTAFDSIPDGTGTPLVVTLTTPTDVTVENTQFIPYKFTSKTDTVITGIQLKAISASANTYIMTYGGETLNIKVYQLSTETEGYVVLKNTEREQDPYISFGADMAIVYTSIINESNTFKIEMYSTDCSYTPWSSNGPSGECPTTCGYAGGPYQTREFIQATGGECSITRTPNDLSRTCPATPPCYTCAVSDWTPDTGATCSAPSCGGGKIRQIRSFTGGGNSAKCPGVSLTQDADCNTNPCPVNCAYSTTTWNAWTPAECPKSCGPIVTRTRSRPIATPAAYGGLQCGPAPTATETCPTACTSTDCKDPVPMPTWGPCSKPTCGLGMKYRTVQPTREDNGACTSRSDSEQCIVRECTNDDCTYTYDNTWTPCSSGCGTGTQYRTSVSATRQDGQGSSCPTRTEPRNCPTLPVCSTYTTTASPQAFDQTVEICRVTATTGDYGSITYTPVLNIATLRFVDNNKLKLFDRYNSEVYDFGTVNGRFMTKINNSGIISTFYTVDYWGGYSTEDRTVVSPESDESAGTGSYTYKIEEEWDSNAIKYKPYLRIYYGSTLTKQYPPLDLCTGWNLPCYKTPLTHWDGYGSRNFMYISDSANPLKQKNGVGPYLYVSNNHIILYNRDGITQRYFFGYSTNPMFDLNTGIVKKGWYESDQNNPIKIDPRRNESELYKRNGPFTYRIEEDASQNAFLRIYRHDGTLAKQYPPQ